MPNWSSNIIKIIGSEKDILDFVKSGVKENDVTIENALNVLDKENVTLDSFNPMPNIFKEIDTTNSMRSFDLFVNGFGIVFNKPFMNKKQEDYFKLIKYIKYDEESDEIKAFLHKIWDDAYNKYVSDYQQACTEQQEKYGVVGWYDWGLKYRGTKWDAECEDWSLFKQDNGLYELQFYCETAWSLPNGWLETISEKFPNLLVGVYATEESHAYLGYLIYNNGNIKYENMYDGNIIIEKMKELGFEVDEIDNTDEYWENYYSTHEELECEITDQFESDLTFWYEELKIKE